MRLFVLLVVLGATAFSPVAAAAPTPPGSDLADIQRRVRTVDARVTNAIALGMARSAAFREVVQRVERRDVIVYIELDSQLPGRLAGRMRWVAKTRDARYVRVSLNPELSSYVLVATLAHELQHVAEVGDAPSIVDEATLSAFYRVVGTARRAHYEAWDTAAAQLTGETVRRELATAVARTDPALVARSAAAGQ